MFIDYQHSLAANCNTLTLSLRNNCFLNMKIYNIFFATECFYEENKRMYGCAVFTEGKERENCKGDIFQGFIDLSKIKVSMSSFLRTPSKYAYIHLAESKVYVMNLKLSYAFPPVQRSFCLHIANIPWLQIALP